MSQPKGNRFVEGLITAINNNCYFASFILKDDTRNIDFLIDTGATISLIKKSAVPKDAEIHYDILADLKGIDKVDKPIRTLGYVELEFIGNLNLLLHIVDDNFPIRRRYIR